MFGISSSELVVIVLLGFMIIGPKEMIKLAYEAGKWMTRIKNQMKYIKNVQFSDLEKTANQTNQTNIPKIEKKIENPVIENNVFEPKSSN